MKNLLVILFMLPSLAFGQQFLWSTAEVGEVKNKDVALIPIENVADKVLSYYDFYEYYYDLSGFSKDGFKEFLKIDPKTANSIQWDSTTQFEKPTAFAFKGNDGRGSFVVVMFMQKENIDLIIFSNDIGRGSVNASYGDREKFSNWFHSFWEYGEKSYNHKSNDPLSTEYLGYDSNLELKSIISPNALYTGKIGDATLSLENRRFVVAPKIEDDGKKSGKVAVEVRVDREGKIISARAGVRGTTISNSDLYEQCERAALGAQLNRLDKAPPVQTGVIVFNFKLK